jgi:D,D-heptose 1,7-bisphosphate phosphatase
MKSKAIFLDRDWVLNYDSNYVYKLEDLIVLPWNIEAISILKKLWYILIVVTNQSWISRGYYTIDECNKFNKQLEFELNVKFDEIYVCPHHKSEMCECRKPKIYNILDAKSKYNLDLQNSYFVWDKSSDVQCWLNAWLKTVYIINNQYSLDTESDYMVWSLLEFANILKNDI